MTTDEAMAEHAANPCGPVVHADRMREVELELVELRRDYNELRNELLRLMDCVSSEDHDIIQNLLQKARQ